jgi:hypothetical protein
VLTFYQHAKLQALVQSAFASDGTNREDLPRRTISINTQLMWDIILYASGMNRGGPTVGGLRDGAEIRGDSDNEDDNTIEMEISHEPTIEVILSNGQAVPPQSGQRRSRDITSHLQHSDGASDQAETSGVPAGRAIEPSDPNGLAPWPVPANASTLDMTYDPFFQFQVPGDPFLSTWEVGNL